MLSVIEPSEETAFFSKWNLLLIEGGTLVLRDIFDRAHPPQYLGQHLNQPNNRSKLLDLVNRGTITVPQKDLLYPPNGTPISSSFDISLLACLLRRICRLKSSSPAWSGIPSQTDFSVEADICRLRLLRNESAHANQASMTKPMFTSKWSELEQVLLRLGSGITTLKVTIDHLKAQTIDPLRENELMEEIRDWECRDFVNKEEIKELTKNFNKKMSDVLLKTRTCCRQNRELHSKFGRMQKEQQAWTKTAIKCYNETARSLQKDFKQVEEAKELARMKKEVSPELEALASSTSMYIEDASSDDTYVKTSFHENAKELLRMHNIVVLCGNPGEGKTTMALRLMMELFVTDKCLRLREPSDWKYVDVGLGNFELVFIDDIFGAGVIDDQLVKEWGKYLPDIQKACQTRKLKCIITSRQYILEDAKDILKPTQLFDDLNIVTLSSDKLSEQERSDILQKHLTIANRPFQMELINNCVTRSGVVLQSNLKCEVSNTTFGFPQSVKMFANNEKLFRRKDKFFSNPTEMFRKYLDELYHDKVKFLPLLLLWSRVNKKLLLSEIGISATSHELKRIAKKFGFSLKPKLVKILRKSLQNHQSGFVSFNSKEGSYSFSHQVIDDTVGLVVSKAYPDAAIEVCSREFMLSHVTTRSSKRDDNHFYIEEHLYRKLGERLLCLLLNPTLPYSESTFKRFKKGGTCPNTISVEFTLDCALIFCDAFKKANFIVMFVNIVEDERNRLSAEKLLSIPVMKLSGHFLGRGINLDDCVITFPDFILLHGGRLLFEELLNRNTLQKLGCAKHNLEMSLLVATHLGKTDFVRLLLDKGAIVSEDVLYIGAMVEDTELLKVLLERRPLESHDKSRVLNGNNALTAAAKKGLVSSVKCLVDSKYDLAYTNSDGLCALDKALIYRKVEVCRILIEAGSPLNTRTGKFKRTPLHIACDTGLPEVVRMLLQHGASPNEKDAKGHYPIHCAAFQNRISVVKVLLEHDINLAKQRIVSFSKSSPVKGMTVFHIAVMQNFYELLEALVESNADANVPDNYGRTPLYYTVITGGLGYNSLRKVADVNKPEKQGITPLHAALIRGMVNICIDLCLREDILLNATDKLGRTPLHIAFSYGFVGLGLKMILFGNADMRMITKDGRSIFHILKERSNTNKRFKLKGVYFDELKNKYPQSEFADHEISYDSLFNLLKLIDPCYAHYTRGLNL